MTLKMLAVMAVAVFVVDLSGFTESWRGWLSSKLGGRQLRPLPPFDCSLCLTWWGCIIAAVICGDFGWWTLPTAGAFALLAKPAGELVQALLDLLTTLVGQIDKLTNKISKR